MLHLVILEWSQSSGKPGILAWIYRLAPAKVQRLDSSLKMKSVLFCYLLLAQAVAQMDDDSGFTEQLPCLKAASEVEAGMRPFLSHRSQAHRILKPFPRTTPCLPVQGPIGL
jgi:hypothetical protein